jgi:hypothetical protein
VRRKGGQKSGVRQKLLANGSRRKRMIITNFLGKGVAGAHASM